MCPCLWKACMSKIKLGKAFHTSGLPYQPGWVDEISVELPDDYTIFEHQYSGTNLLGINTRAGLFDEAGAGKTMCLQLNALWRISYGNKVLGLMPPVLLKQFHSELHDKFPGIEDYVRCEIFRGTPAQRAKMVERYEIEGWPEILLMTYQLFNGTKSRPGLWRPMKERDYSVLIADEAQALNNCDSKLHKRVFNYVGGREVDAPTSNALVLATGTPSHTRAEDCYGLVRLTAPMILGITANIGAGLVEAFFLARVGTLELAAYSFTFAVSGALMSLSLGISIGLSSVLARTVGSGDRRATDHGVRTA